MNLREEILKNSGVLNEEKEVPFNLLKGKIITKIVGAKKGSESIQFHTKDNNVYEMLPESENEIDLGNDVDVSVDDIVGNINDLLNSKILKAEKRTNKNKKPEYRDLLWTFYQLATEKGYVDIKWYGRSNGHYSVEVKLVERK